MSLSASTLMAVVHVKEEDIVVVEGVVESGDELSSGAEEVYEVLELDMKSV